MWPSRCAKATFTKSWRSADASWPRWDSPTARSSTIFSTTWNSTSEPAAARSMTPTSGAAGATDDGLGFYERILIGERAARIRHDPDDQVPERGKVKDRRHGSGVGNLFSGDQGLCFGVFGVAAGRGALLVLQAVVVRELAARRLFAH